MTGQPDALAEALLAAARDPANKSFAQMMALLVEFGMSPSSRTKVKTAKAVGDGNPFDEFD